MAEPTLLGYPITALFLYFMFYSFAGWCVETAYCCIQEKRWVARGFLYGPFCPIYGVGVLLMILFFTPFQDHLLLFYLVATVVMSCWEYFVGWFLEATTHIKYWDYSDRRFHLKGRVCLSISLCWGMLSYVAIFLLHPPVARLFETIAPWLRYVLAGVLFALLAVDAASTIRKLTLVTRLMNRLQTTGDELRVQLALGKMDLIDNLDEAGELLRQRLDEALDAVPDSVRQRVLALRESYAELLEKAERQSRRFRNRYRAMRSTRYTLEDVKRAGARLKETLDSARRERAERLKSGK